MLKKIIKIVIILIVIVAVGFGAYWFFDRQQQGPSAGGSLSIGDFFPFGHSPEPAPTPSTTPGTPPSEVPEQNQPATPPRLWKVSQSPQAGATTLKIGDNILTRFVDKATGNVFENSLVSPSLNRISNTTIPKVYEALWQPKGDTVILRYPNENNIIQTLFAKMTIPQATSTDAGPSLYELQGTFLPSQIGNLSVLPSNGRLAYVIENPGDGGDVFVTDAAGSKPKKILSSSIHEWLISWQKEDSIVITTKPSSQVPGYSYLLNTKTGALTKIIGNVKGLTLLTSPDLAYALVSEGGKNSVNLTFLNIKSDTRGDITQTLSEKCVWMKDNVTILCAIPQSIPSGEYPDHWYQGRVSFSDTFWKFNVATGASELIADPQKEVREEIDVINPALDPSETYLIFTNKKDSQLWSLRLTKES